MRLCSFYFAFAFSLNCPFYFFNPIPKGVRLDFLIWFVLGTNFSQSNAPEGLGTPVPLKPLYGMKPQLLPSALLAASSTAASQRPPSLQQATQQAHHIPCFSGTAQLSCGLQPPKAIAGFPGMILIAQISFPRHSYLIVTSMQSKNRKSEFFLRN